MDPDSAQVRAAGCVVWRAATSGEIEIALVHRPRYDDWSLPKGKLDPGERWEAAALREVWEETGLTARCEEELTPHSYADRKGRPKIVRWWRMSVEEIAPFAVNDEVDERRWVSSAEAERLLDYEHDRALVREALGSV